MTLDPVDRSPDEPQHETAADIRAEEAILARAIGGWRGVIDSSVPSAVFLTAYLVSSQDLSLSLRFALAAGALIVVWRLIRRQSLQQVVAGFIGVGVSAFVASRTGRAEDFYLPGLLVNLAYGLAFLVSIVVRWPLVGVITGLLTGQGTTWRANRDIRRAYAAASWIWVGLFLGRVAVWVPLYLAGWVAALGIARLAMGWPLFLLAAYVTYLVLRPTLARMRAGQPETSE